MPTFLPFQDVAFQRVSTEQIKNSVFRENVKALNSEVVLQLEELRAMIRDKAKGIPE